MKCIAQTEGKRSWYKIRCLLLKLLNIAKARNFLEVSNSQNVPRRPLESPVKIFFFCALCLKLTLFYYLIVSIYFH